jgi:hypothetical protein
MANHVSSRRASQTKPTSQADADRADRLKAALKANLGRRKAQARARAETDTSSKDDADNE